MNAERSAEAVGDLIHCSVLFADIRDFSALTRSIGNARCILQVQRFYEICDEAVAAHGGFVHNHIGDAVLGMFGIDIEGYCAKNAFSAAIQIQKNIALNSDLLFTVGIGIASGEVARANHDYIGHPLNLASRISGKALGGQILTSDSRHYGETDSQRFCVPSVSLKGIGTTPVFEVVANAGYQSEVTP